MVCYKGSLVLLVCVVVLSTACGQASRLNSNNNETVIYSGQGFSGGAISEVDLVNNAAIISIGPEDRDTDHIVAISHYNANGQTLAYQLSESAVPTELASIIESQFLVKEDITTDFHEYLRAQEGLLDEAALIDMGDAEAPASLIKAATVGDTRSFKVLGGFSTLGGNQSVVAELRFQTSHFNAYVDVRDQASLDNDDLEDLLQDFDDVIPTEQAFFGTESDVDNDGRFNILFTRAVNQLGASAGGIVTGFFYAIDLFSADQYEQSNETEIFYTFIPDPTGAHGAAISKEFALSNILKSVLPHEYQHMINFNQHYFIHDGAPELAFVNEGISHLAEDIYSLDSNGYMTTTGIENPARIAGYLQDIDNLCFTCGASLYQRGGSYLFLRWLYEQAEKGNLSAVSDGAGLLYRLLDSDAIGIDNIVAAALGDGVQDIDGAFADLMGQFGLAVFASDTTLTSDNRFTIDGVSLRASQNDNRGTVLQGPGISLGTDFPLTQTIGAASMGYVELSASDIQGLNGQLQLQLSPSSNFRVFLIKAGS